MIVYVVAIVLASLVVIILGVIFFKWLNGFVYDHSGFEVLDLKMILLLFCGISLVCLTGLAYVMLSQAAGYCSKGNHQWYGSAEQGEAFLGTCQELYPKAPYYMPTGECSRVIEKCYVSKKLGKKDWVALIFLGVLAVVTFAIPMRNGLLSGGWGVFGFLVQLFLAVILFTIVVLITVLISGRSARDEKRLSLPA